MLPSRPSVAAMSASISRELQARLHQVDAPLGPRGGGGARGAREQGEEERARGHPREEHQGEGGRQRDDERRGTRHEQGGHHGERPDGQGQGQGKPGRERGEAGEPRAGGHQQDSRGREQHRLPRGQADAENPRGKQPCREHDGRGQQQRTAEDLVHVDRARELSEGLHAQRRGLGDDVAAPREDLAAREPLGEGLHLSPRPGAMQDGVLGVVEGVLRRRTRRGWRASRVAPRRPARARAPGPARPRARRPPRRAGRRILLRSEPGCRGSATARCCPRSGSPDGGPGG